MEGDCGDFYGLAGVIVDVEAVLRDPANPKSDALYRAGCRADSRPHAANRQERGLRAAAGRMEHAGAVLRRHPKHSRGQRAAGDEALRNPIRASTTRDVPLERGRIQLQSEGAEVFFRNVAIRPIRALPDK